MSQVDHASADFKSGFVAITGAPNTGKSTLLNRILGQKISITSQKPQTTRNRILGVLHRPCAQLIFIDTPGVHQAKLPLNIRIVEAALTAIGDVDLILIVVDAARPDTASEEFLIKRLENQNRPVILALNKIDLIEKTGLLDMIDQWTSAYAFKAVVPIAAKHGTQVEVLIQELERHLPSGPPLFTAETLTDMPERFICAEMIREKVFRLTGQEIPYSTAVSVESFTEEKSGALVKIYASIHVERNSQKGMVIGKHGNKLKQIGKAARHEIERMLGTKVLLKLFVRVQKNWSKDTKALKRFGY